MCPGAGCITLWAPYSFVCEECHKKMGRIPHVCHWLPAMTPQCSRTHTNVTRLVRNTPWTFDLLAGDTESIFSLQLAATFHSVRLMSDTEACLSCEIPALVASLLAGASHSRPPPCWTVLTAHTQCRYSLNVLMLHSQRGDTKTSLLCKVKKWL